MKVVNLCLALPASILAIAGVGSAAETGTSVSTQDLQAKIEYCQTCHGLLGEGYRGASTMPRLAGQQTEYLENQLQAFSVLRRKNNFMFEVTHGLTPAMIPALAAHFRDLNPKAVTDAPRELVAAGKTIFEEGVPAAAIPPCASCHGPEAKGDGASPRLAGQLYDYTRQQLANWSKDRDQYPAKPDTSAIMQPIAHGLTEAQIAAVAAYLNYLE
jgi:cytochrome c553